MPTHRTRDSYRQFTESFQYRQPPHVQDQSSDQANRRRKAPIVDPSDPYSRQSSEVTSSKQKTFLIEKVFCLLLSGYRESNPNYKTPSLAYYHYTIPRFITIFTVSFLHLIEKRWHYKENLYTKNEEKALSTSSFSNSVLNSVPYSRMPSRFTS